MKRMMILFAAAAVMVAPLRAQAQGMENAGAVSLQMAGFAGARAQVKDDLFAGTEKFAAGATDVTEINLDPKMMGMVGGKKGDVSGLARKMKFIVIHTYTYDKPGMYRMEDVDTYRKKLEDGTWNCAIHVRDKDGTTDICSRSSPDHEGNEMVILTAEPKELTFIHMSGDMSLDDLSKMGGSAGGLKKR
jgi:hypothetical protein